MVLGAKISCMTENPKPPKKIKSNEDGGDSSGGEPDNNITVGSIIFNNATNEYGKIVSMDETTGKIQVDKMTEAQAMKELGVV